MSDPRSASRIPTRGGRPTKLTPEVLQAIITAVRAGNYLDVAAAYAGIDRATLYRWLKRGRRDRKGIYREFCDRYQKALAESEMRDLQTIGKVAQGGELVTVEHKETTDADGNTTVYDKKVMARPEWTAAAWRLERKFPKRWGRRARAELTAKGAASPAGPVQIIVLGQQEPEGDDGWTTIAAHHGRIALEHRHE